MSDENEITEEIETSEILVIPQQATPTKLLPRKESPELRLSVVETVCYQQPGMDPLQVPAGFSYFVQNNEQPFQRFTFAKPEWESINTGWLEKASCVLIQNKYDLIKTRKPTPEELEEAQKHLIEVKFEDSKYCFEIPVGESMRFRVADLTALRIRSLNGLTKYLCVLIPE